MSKVAYIACVDSPALRKLIHSHALGYELRAATNLADSVDRKAKRGKRT